MDLLSAIALRYLRHAGEDEEEIYIGASHEISSSDSDTDDGRLGDRHNRVPARFAGGSILDRSGARHGRKDRTAWGEYIENCPPILPTNASITGFEDEVLLIAERLRKKADRRSKKYETLATDDEVTSDEDSDDEEERDAQQSHDDHRVRRAATAPHARDDIWSSLTPFPSLSSFPSSLFGSTTRPAARTLRASEVTETTKRSATSLRKRNMAAAKAHWWITLWFLVSAPVIFWDASYCFMRPRSFAGGDLHWIWKPYEIYQEVDYVYGVEAYKRGDGFTNAQSLMNVVETFLNLYYVYAQHAIESPAAPLIGFAAVVMTLSKTVLYWLQEYYCGGCSVGHNDLQTLFVYWIIPNGIWLLVPSLIMWRLGQDITKGLTTASKLSSSKKEH